MAASLPPPRFSDAPAGVETARCAGLSGRLVEDHRKLLAAGEHDVFGVHAPPHDRVPVGRPRRIQQVSWESLRSASTAREWTVEFLTPTSFRTGKHSHAIPTAGLVLRSAQLAWNKFSPAPPISLSRSIMASE